MRRQAFAFFEMSESTVLLIRMFICGFGAGVSFCLIIYLVGNLLK